jgi:hypothetical protein
MICKTLPQPRSNGARSCLRSVPGDWPPCPKVSQTFERVNKTVTIYLPAIFVVAMIGANVAAKRFGQRTHPMVS